MIYLSFKIIKNGVGVFGFSLQWYWTSNFNWARI